MKAQTQLLPLAPPRGEHPVKVEPVRLEYLNKKSNSLNIHEWRGGVGYLPETFLIGWLSQANVTFRKPACTDQLNDCFLQIFLSQKRHTIYTYFSR